MAHKSAARSYSSSIGAKTGFKKGYLKDLLISGAIEHAGSGKEQDAIASRASIIQEKAIADKKRKKDEVKRLAKAGKLADKSIDKEVIIRKYGIHNFEFALFNQEINNDIPKLMLKKEYVDKVKSEHRIKKLKDHHLEAWEMYHIEGVDPAGIAKHFKKTRSLILNKYKNRGYLAIFDQEIAGYLAEYVIRDVYYPKLYIYGGSYEPDLCDNLDRPKIMVEVKKRGQREAPIPRMLSRSEIEFVINQGEVHLVILVMMGGNTMVEQYKVTIKK